MAGEQSKMRALVVGICGGTGSGKSTLTRGVVQSLPADSVALLEQDHYYRDHSDRSVEERGALNFDHPDAVDMPLLIEHVRRLRAGEAVARPTYDFSRHARAKETVAVVPRPLVIIDGILIFANETLRGLIDFKVFVDADADIRFIRRLGRDVEKRGRSVESVIEQYLATVRPMHLQFVEPMKRFADLIIPDGGKGQAGIDLVVAKIRSLGHLAG